MGRAPSLSRRAPRVAGQRTAGSEKKPYLKDIIAKLP